MPILVKILVSFTVILVANRFLRNLAVSILIGSAVLAAWSGHGLVPSLGIAWEMFSSIDNVSLMVVVLLIIWLSGQMQESGIMKDLVTTIRSRISKKLSLAILPAVIGLLPMPGGALFSAPLVDDCDAEKAIDPLQKTRINFWFRHIWEYCWPLYPAVLLAIDISGLEVWQLILAQLPLTLVTVFAGWLFILRPIQASGTLERGKAQPFLLLVSPIIVVIGVYTLISVFLPAVSGLWKYTPMGIGIVIAIAFLQILRPIPAAKWKKLVFSLKPLNMVVIVAAIRIYGAFIEARLPGGMLLMEQMREELNHFGIPPLLLVVLIPLISGITTGIAVGFIGASFPIVMILLGSDPTLGQTLATVAIAYACGEIGMLLSPMHVCLVVTNEYFKTRLGQSIVSFLKPCLVVLAGAFALAGVIRLILG